MNYNPTLNEDSDEFYGRIPEFNKRPPSHVQRSIYSNKDFFIEEFIGEPSKIQPTAEDYDKIEFVYRKERIYSEQPPSASIRNFLFDNNNHQGSGSVEQVVTQSQPEH